MAEAKLKTYKNITEEPLLKIEHDDDFESPREWSNVGYFLTREDRHSSPDGEDNELYSIMIEAELNASDSEDHAKLIKKLAKEQGINVVAVHPINRYEHSSVSYSVGSASGFDSSNCGFYIVTEETAKEIGIKKAGLLKAIKQELEVYNQWVHGEVYRFTLFDKDGEIADSCCGFYEIEAIRDRLPKEWENENLEGYLVD